MGSMIEAVARHLDEGRPEEALRLALAVVAERPSDARAHALAAAACHTLGRPEDGMQWFRRAMALDPADPEFACGLAACQYDLKLPQAARTTLEALLTKQPAHLQGWRNLALACEACGDNDAAGAALERAVTLAPERASVRRESAALAMRANRPQDALRHARAAHAMAPQEPLVLHVLLECALKAGDADTAEAAARALLDIDAQDPFARRGLAMALSISGALEDATREAARVPEGLRVGFDARQALLSSGARAVRDCDWRHLPAWLDAAAALAAEPAGRLGGSEIAFLALATGLAAPQCAGLFAAHIRHIDATERALAWPRAPRGQRTKLRLGYLGTGFGEHPSGMALNPILLAHNRERFELYCYALSGDDGSAWRAEALAAADVFRVVPHMSATELAGLVAVDDIDLLVDFSGLLIGGRAAAHRHRTARAHLLLFETPALLKLPGIDTTIGDAVVLDAAEPGARLPHCLLPLDPRWARTALEGEAPRRADHGLPEGVPVLCCFNTSYKIEPTVFGAWMRILKRCPDAVLWLRDGGDAMRDNLGGAARDAGIAPERLFFAARLPFAEHLRRARLADLFLDTFHYGAHVTGLQALAAGVPLLTLRGDRFSARIGASALVHAGLGDTLATDVDDYVERAARLCEDLAWAGQWRRRTLAAFAPAASQARFEAYVHSLEDLYLRVFAKASGRF